MKATWKPPAGSVGNSLVICAGPPAPQRGAGSKVLISSTPGYLNTVQLAAYPRAEFITPFSRKNVTTTERLVVQNEFATVGECLAFFHRLGEWLGGPGILELLYPGGGGDSLDAVMQSVDVLSHIGVAATIQYTFIGGLYMPGPATNQ